MEYHIIHGLRKGRLLRPSSFGCLKGIPTINITNGCIFQCSYCYARGYSQTHKIGDIILYINIPDLLEKELSRAREIPVGVILNTSSDCFQSHPEILKISFKTIEILLNAGCSISFLTKGIIPQRFLDLFSKFPNKIFAQIGIVSLSEIYWRNYEPGTPSPFERLKNIDQLRTIGILPEIRIDPIIPFITDIETEIRFLFENLAEKGIKNVTLSYLHFRPAIEKQLMKELSPLHQRLLQLCFMTQEWRSIGSSTMTKLLPRVVRENGYKKIKKIAQGFGINASICQCKNPDIEGNLCGSGRIKSLLKNSSKNQLPLFQC